MILPVVKKGQTEVPFLFTTFVRYVTAVSTVFLGECLLLF